MEEEEVYIIVEQMPGFPGGEEALLKYISDHIEYPTMAVERGIEGRVTVRFVVNKDGYVQDVTVIRGVHELLDKEAVRVIQSLPRWNPGKTKWCSRCGLLQRSRELHTAINTHNHFKKRLRIRSLFYFYKPRSVRKGKSKKTHHFY